MTTGCRQYTSLPSITIFLAEDHLIYRKGTRISILCDIILDFLGTFRLIEASFSCNNTIGGNRTTNIRITIGTLAPAVFDIDDILVAGVLWRAATKCGREYHFTCHLKIVFSHFIL